MDRSVVVVLVVLVMSRVCWSESDYERSVINTVLDPRPPAVTLSSKSESACVGCMKKITLVEGDEKYDLTDSSQYVTQEVLTALRVEYVKNQILKKLRLREKPVISMTHLPRMVRENGDIMPKIYKQEAYKKDSEDDYAQTTQAIMFPYDGIYNIIKLNTFITIDILNNILKSFHLIRF